MIKKIHLRRKGPSVETAVKKIDEKTKKNMIKETKAKMCNDGDAKMQLFIETKTQISQSTNDAPNYYIFFLVSELK